MEVSQLLERERHSILDVFTEVRYKVADTDSADAIRERVRGVLTGEQKPEEASWHDVGLAGLAGAADTLDGLVEKGGQKDARERAAALPETERVCRAVSEVLGEHFDAVRLEASVGGMGGVVVVVEPDSDD